MFENSKDLYQFIIKNTDKNGYFTTDLIKFTGENQGLLAAMFDELETRGLIERCGLSTFKVYQ